MSLNRMEIVVLLHECRKVTEVAHRLGVKQPTISFHMKRLEETYGVQLFEHRMGKILFTEAGKALYHYAAKIHALAEEANRVVQEFDRLERGSLRIGASYVPGVYLLSDILLRFAEQYPRISVQLEIKTAPAIQQALRQHELDVGIISVNGRPSSDFIVEPIQQDELVLVVPVEHPLATKSQVTPADIVKEPFILHNAQSTTRQMMEAWIRGHEMTFRTKLELNSVDLIKRFVMEGHGISCLSRLAVEKEIEAGTLACLPVPGLKAERMIYCCHHRERLMTKPISLFLEAVNGLK